MLVIRYRPTEISRGAIVLVLTGSQCSSIHPSSAKRRLEWMRCGSHPERCVDEKIPRPPRPCGQHDYGACQRQAPTGRIRHHRPEQECCRTVVKDDGRDWSRGVNVMTRFSFSLGSLERQCVPISRIWQCGFENVSDRGVFATFKVTRPSEHYYNPLGPLWFSHSSRKYSRC